MTGTAQSVLDAALRLPDDERAELAAILADSVGDGTSKSELDASWIAEARRRYDAVKAGAPVLASQDVERELDALLKACLTDREAG